MRVGERSRGRDADPQAGEGARPDADREAVDLGEVDARLGQQRERERQQLADVAGTLTGRRLVAAREHVLI